MCIVKRKGLEHMWILAFMGDSGVNPRILRDDCFTCCFQEDFLTHLLSISIFIALELEHMFGILKIETIWKQGDGMSSLTNSSE